MDKYKVLDETKLKLIAAAIMLIDHAGQLFNNNTLMRIIGRLAFPIFAFCISEGYIHTRNKRKYLLRMGVFALISEIPFNLFNHGTIFYLGYQNVMWTFFIALLGLDLYEKVNKDNSIINQAKGFAIVFALGALCELINTDYGVYGVILVFTYYYFKNYGYLIRNICGAIIQFCLYNVGLVSMFSAGIIYLYNGKKGKGYKILFYLFYPVHLLVLWLLSCI